MTYLKEGKVKTFAESFGTKNRIKSILLSKVPRLYTAAIGAENQCEFELYRKNRMRFAH